MPQANREFSGQRFVSAVGDALGQNASRLQTAVDRITAYVLKSAKLDPELIVAFQEFDRLKQEFDALAIALHRFDGGEEHEAANAEAALRSISVSDLRLRLAAALREGGSPEQDFDRLAVSDTATETKVF